LPSYACAIRFTTHLPQLSTFCTLYLQDCRDQGRLAQTGKARQRFALTPWHRAAFALSWP